MLSSILVTGCVESLISVKIQARIFYAVLWYYVRIPTDDIQNVEILYAPKN